MAWDDLALETVENQSTSLRRLMDHVSELRATAEDLHTQAKTLEDEADRICQVELPELFRELGITEIYGDGFKAELKHVVSATINKDDREAAYEWLEKSGGSSLVTTTVKVVLPKGLADQAEKILHLGETLGGRSEVQPYVHPMTLSKWVRERLEKGIGEVPDAIKVYNAQVVKFKETM